MVEFITFHRFCNRLFQEPWGKYNHCFASTAIVARSRFPFDATVRPETILLTISIWGTGQQNCSLRLCVIKILVVECKWEIRQSNSPHHMCDGGKAMEWVRVLFYS